MDSENLCCDGATETNDQGQGKPMGKRDLIIEAYLRTGSVKAACAEVGMMPYNAYIILKTAGVMKIEDKRNYGTTIQRYAADAEAEFQKLVPFAMPANKVIRANNPIYDFDVQGMKVDVKLCIDRPSKQRKSVIDKNGNSKLVKGGSNYAFNTANHHDKDGHPDFYAVFICDSGKISKGYRVLLIPDELVGDAKTVNFSKDEKADWWNFEIQPSELAQFFADAMAGLVGEECAV